MPEHLAGKIKPGAVAHIRVSALPEETFDGTLLRFGTAADKASGTIDAIFALPNPSLTLRPEMRAEFSIVLSKRAGVMSIPRAALQGDASNRSTVCRARTLIGRKPAPPIRFLRGDGEGAAGVLAGKRQQPAFDDHRLPRIAQPTRFDSGANFTSDTTLTNISNASMLSTHRRTFGSHFRPRGNSDRMFVSRM